MTSSQKRRASNSIDGMLYSNKRPNPSSAPDCSTNIDPQAPAGTDVEYNKPSNNPGTGDDPLLQLSPLIDLESNKNLNTNLTSQCDTQPTDKSESGEESDSEPNHEIDWYNFEPAPDSECLSGCCNRQSNKYTPVHAEPAILTPEQADRPCANFAPKELLCELCELSGIRLSMGHPRVERGIDFLLENRHDFGTAYAWFRTALHFTHKVYNSELLGSSPYDGGLIFGREWEVDFCTSHKPDFKPLYELPELQEYDPTLMAKKNHGRLAIRDSLSNCNDLIPTGLSFGVYGEQVISEAGCIQPRRLWDLWSNRIVPWDWHIRFDGLAMDHWAECPAHNPVSVFFAVSHSWTTDMHPIHTPVNKGEWPVPMPKDVTIEALRQELIKLTLSRRQDDNPTRHCLQYCWLDMLCLRQLCTNSQAEVARIEEWAIDVPTIGNVYAQTSFVARYMNGLGRPFRTDGWDDKHHWTRRVWTIQEVIPLEKENNIIMGLPNCQELEKMVVEVGAMKVRAKKIVLWYGLYDPWTVRGVWVVFYDLIRQIARRECSNESDRIAALNYLLKLNPMPIYEVEENIEDAWARCLRYFPRVLRLQLLWNFPQTSLQQRMPSWHTLVNLYNQPELPRREIPTDMPTSCPDREPVVKISNSRSLLWQGLLHKGELGPMDDELSWRRNDLLVMMVSMKKKITTFACFCHGNIKSRTEEGHYTLTGDINSTTQPGSLLQEAIQLRTYHQGHVLPEGFYTVLIIYNDWDLTFLFAETSVKTQKVV